MSRDRSISTGEPRLASFASWLVLAASFGLSASTWISLGVLAGFTDHITIHGVTVLRLAWLMPFVVDGYVVVALVLWMAPVPATVAAFAKKNTYMAAGVGIAAQSAYHLLSIWSTTGVIWKTVLAAIIGAVPPASAGLAVHMRALIRRESSTNSTTVPTTTTSTTATHIHRPTIAPAAVPAPADDVPAPIPAPSLVDTAPAVPAPTPSLAPTPAALAARIAVPRPTPTPTVPAVAPPSPARPAAARSTSPATPAPKLAPSTTDTHVAASDAAQLSLPLVSPELLDRAEEVARQYQAEHGTPITPGQLAVRLKVTSAMAVQVLAALDLQHPTTVNGRRPAKATW